LARSEVADTPKGWKPHRHWVSRPAWTTKYRCMLGTLRNQPVTYWYRCGSFNH